MIQDWTKYCLKGIYQDVYIKVYDIVVTTPTGFSNIQEECFDCACYDGQGFDTSRHYLRTSLIGSLYKIVEIPKRFKERQLSIFDFI